MPSPAGEVKVTAISDAICRIAKDGFVDLLKLDCEGGEWNIVEDTEAMKRIAKVTMEYHLTGSKAVKDLLAILRNIGFHIDFVHGDGDKYGRIHARRN